MEYSDQLPVPSAVKEDSKAFELLRVWVANKKQHVSLRTEVWDDPASWGIMLVDLARHIASSYQKDRCFDQSETLQRIKSAFDVEFATQTDEPSGQTMADGGANC